MNFQQASLAFLQRAKSYSGFWCVAGGWAIDLYLGYQTRSHEDLELVVLRSEWPELYRHFAAYNPRKIFSGDPPTFVPWTGDEINSEVIQLRLDPVDEAEFDLLLTPSDGENWVCRRDETIRRPLKDVVAKSKEGVPFLRPEIVLLFKAKYVRDKDQSDFDHVVPTLAASAKTWLRTALERIHPGHAWLRPLSD